MTDDEILAAADRICARRLNQARLDNFLTQKTVMIRWDNPVSKFGESYSSIVVSAESVRAVVEAHFAPMVTA